MNQFIYNQHKIPKNKWKYGIFPSSFSGCGWIAIYNALILLGHKENPEAIINYLKKHIPIFNGLFGTCILSISAYLKSLDFSHQIAIDKTKFDTIALNNKVSILYFFWISKFKIGAHYIAIENDKNTFLGYNTFLNSHGPDYLGASIELFLKKNHYFFPILVTISSTIDSEE